MMVQQTKKRKHQDKTRKLVATQEKRAKNALTMVKVEELSHLDELTPEVHVQKTSNASMVVKDGPMEETQDSPCSFSTLSTAVKLEPTDALDVQPPNDIIQLLFPATDSLDSSYVQTDTPSSFSIESYSDELLDIDEEQTEERPTSSNGNPSRKSVDFNAAKKAQIQRDIDNNLCTFKSQKDGIEVVVKNDVEIACRCTSCFALFSTKTRTYIRTHLKRCKETSINRAPYPLSHSETAEISMNLINFVGCDQRSFATTQTESFKNLIQTAVNIGFKVGRNFSNFNVPEDIVPCVYTIKSTLHHQVQNRIAAVKNFLKEHSINRTSIILDYTSLVYQYMGVIMQFMYESKIISFLIYVQDTDESTTSANLKKVIENVLKHFGLKLELQFYIIDEGANVANAFHGLNSSVCLCHALNTIVKRTTNPYKVSERNAVEVSSLLTDEIYETVNNCQLLINKLKTLVAAVRKSTKISTTLSRRLVINCDTRWLSKLQMINSWLNLSNDEKKMLKQFYEDDDGKKKLLEELCQNDNDFTSYLIIMDKLKQKLMDLEHGSRPTSHLVLLAYYDIEDHLISYQSSNNNLLKALSISAYSVLQKKKKYFTHPIFYAACTLDIYHRSHIYRIRGVEESKKAKKETESELINFINLSNTHMVKETVVAESISEEFDDCSMMPDDEKTEFTDTVLVSAKSELAQYYAYKPTAEEIAAKDICAFWNKHSKDFPHLSKFACYVLSVPASSAKIEVAFSGSTSTVSKNLRSMDPSTISDLMIYKSLKNIIIF